MGENARVTDAEPDVAVLSGLLEAFPGVAAPLSPPDEDALAPFATALEGIAAGDMKCLMVASALVTEFDGVDGLVRAWTDWLSPYESFSLELEEWIEAGDRIVVLVRSRARPRGARGEVEQAGGSVWTFEDGRVTRVEFHADRAGALRSAGLAPERPPQSGQA